MLERADVQPTVPIRFTAAPSEAGASRTDCLSAPIPADDPSSKPDRSIEPDRHFRLTSRRLGIQPVKDGKKPDEDG